MAVPLFIDLFHYLQGSPILVGPITISGTETPMKNGILALPRVHLSLNDGLRHQDEGQKIYSCS